MAVSEPNKPAVLTKIFDEFGNLLLEIDALISIDATHRNSLSKFPVEDGGVITENIAKENLILSLQGIISSATTIPKEEGVVTVEYPIQPLVAKSIQRRAFVTKPEVKHFKGAPSQYKNTKVQDARSTLQRISDDKLLVEVINGPNSHQNLIMTMISFRKDSSIGSNAFRFDVKFEQITFATVEVTEKKRAIKSADPTDDNGNKTLEEIAEIEKERLDTTLLDFSFF